MIIVISLLIFLWYHKYSLSSCFDINEESSILGKGFPVKLYFTKISSPRLFNRYLLSLWKSLKDISCFMYFCIVFLEGMAEMINMFGVSVFISSDLLSYKVPLVFGFLPVSFLFSLMSIFDCHWQPCFFVCTTSYVFVRTISFLIFIYLFTFACAGSLLLHGLFSSCDKQDIFFSYSAWAFHRSGFSCYGAQTLGRVGAIVATARLWSTGSIIVAQGLSCSVACGIFLDQGSNCVSCIGKQILYQWAAREAPHHFLSLDSLLHSFPYSPHQFWLPGADQMVNFFRKPPMPYL